MLDAPVPMKIAFVIATGNAHKVQEISRILGDRFQYFTLKDFPGAPSVAEDANSFAGNATKKAVELGKWIGHDAAAIQTVQTFLAHSQPKSEAEVYLLADDSGLEVDALGGAPGVHSARFASSGKEGNAPDAANRHKLLKLLSEVPSEKRTARFRCVIALTPLSLPGAEDASPVCYADEHEFQTRLFEGTCEGRIGFEERGSGGFGYDSLFSPTGYDHTFAELGESIKNTLSHRGQALAALQKAITLNLLRGEH
jgi:XTP/dITP diphosphohydrolase